MNRGKRVEIPYFDVYDVFMRNDEVGLRLYLPYIASSCL